MVSRGGYEPTAAVGEVGGNVGGEVVVGRNGDGDEGETGWFLPISPAMFMVKEKG
jgi:hypothetical protein